MNTFTNPPEYWWIVSIPEFLNALPKELRDAISYFLTFKARHIATIFKQEVLANCHTFNLYAAETEIHSGSPLLYRPSFRTDLLDYGCDGWSIDFRLRIDGSHWDFSNQPDHQYDNWFQGKEANTPLRYIRGSPVPLWWVRHVSTEFSSPFYSLGRRFYHCSAICYDIMTGACRTSLPHGQKKLCNCCWVEDIAWGTGPDPTFLKEYISTCESRRGYKVNKQFVSTTFQHDELSYRKNAGPMSISKYGCQCEDSVFYKQPEWQQHQVQNPKKDCPACIKNLQDAFGDDACLYSAKCVYTRPKTIECFVDKIGWTSYPPLLCKHYRKKERKKRNQHKKKRANRRLTKMPNLVYNSQRV